MFQFRKKNALEDIDYTCFVVEKVDLMGEGKTILLIVFHAY